MILNFMIKAASSWGALGLSTIKLCAAVSLYYCASSDPNSLQVLSPRVRVCAEDRVPREADSQICVPSLSGSVFVIDT